MGDLNDLTTRLDTASRELYALHAEFEPIAEQWDDVWNDILMTLVAEYEDQGKRLPGEDVRNAIVIKRMREEEPILFNNHRRLKAKIDRGERRAKQIEREIFAKQSILSYLKTEAQAVGA
jgi:hypothetical protein